MIVRCAAADRYKTRCAWSRRSAASLSDRTRERERERDGKKGDMAGWNDDGVEREEPPGGRQKKKKKKKKKKTEGEDPFIGGGA